jgi:hypothetical protein
MILDAVSNVGQFQTRTMGRRRALGKWACVIVWFDGFAGAKIQNRAKKVDNGPRAET